MAGEFSDGEDEFASTFDNTTTPFRAYKLSGSNNKPTTRNGRAGPSYRQDATSSSKADVEILEIDTTENEAAAEIVAAKPKRMTRQRSASVEPREPAVPKKSNKTAQNKAKAKGKARSPSPTAMDIDNLHSIEEDVEEVQEVVRPILKPQTKARGKRPLRTSENSAEKEEIQSLQRHLQNMTAQRDELARQLQEVHDTREELEASFEEQERAYHVRLDTQEETIKELTSQVARVNTLVQEGKTSTLHFITREAADEERSELENEVQRLKATVSEMNRKTAEQNERIKTLESDLKAEAEQYKLLAQRSAVNATAVGKRQPVVAASKDPKQRELTKLYEDMTNLLVTDVKFENINAEDETVTFNCMYTHFQSRKSVSFSLRVGPVLEDADDPENENKKQVLYTAELLDDISEDYIKRLDFLGESFTFPRDQMDAFYDRLTFVLSNELDNA